jgi:hypothetical protein
MMRAGEIARSFLDMAGQTALRLIAGQVLGPESEDVPFSSLLGMLGSLAVAGRAAGGCGGVGSQAKILDHSLVADAAALCLLGLGTRAGSDPEEERGDS